MAIITVSRQFGSKGDEICVRLARKMGYRLVDRKALRKRMLDLGCSEAKMMRFDGLRPGPFSAFSRSKDEYTYYLRSAMLSEVSSGNCVVVGRGAFVVFRGIANCVPVKIYEERELRARRVAAKVGVPEGDAMKAVKRADWHQMGFHKSFFNCRVQDFFLFDMCVNSGNSDEDAVVDMIESYVRSKVTDEMERRGDEQLSELSIGQSILRMLLATYGVEIDDLRVDVDGRKITLSGISTREGAVRRAVEILSLEVPEFSVESKVRIVQDSLRH